MTLINKVRSKLTHKLRQNENQRPDQESEPSVIYRPLPYVPILSETLKRILAKYGITKFLTNPNLTLSALVL